MNFQQARPVQRGGAVRRRTEIGAGKEELEPAQTFTEKADGEPEEAQSTGQAQSKLNLVLRARPPQGSASIAQLAREASKPGKLLRTTQSPIGFLSQCQVELAVATRNHSTVGVVRQLFLRVLAHRL